ncbi:acyl-ACP desaturase [Kitasatospora sp. NPDC002040]|uniref:acyl-ACP desaturase n=1 Tax=Kitasatospora sp. NPDC002040 TaxID=3154661 RepID=UPI003320D34B
MTLDMAIELEPWVSEGVNRHLETTRDWIPHRFVPWSRGSDYTSESPEEGMPDRGEPESAGSAMPPGVRSALEINLVTEDNLPSYHFELARRAGRDGAWGTWLHRWTAEEGRHAIAIRDYLLTTRAVDADELERQRMRIMQIGWQAHARDVVEFIAFTSLQERATRISHRNTGRLMDCPRGDRLMARVAADENLHMVFYRDLVGAALAIDPSATVRAVCREVSAFQMPGHVIPGFGRKSAAIACAGIYNLDIHHRQVVLPLIRHWRLFDTQGLDATARSALEGLEQFLENLRSQAARQTQHIVDAAARSSAAAARRAA